MTMKKHENLIDNSGTLFTNIITGFEETTRMIKKPIDIPYFLQGETIKAVRNQIDLFQNINSLILAKDKPLFEVCEHLSHKDKNKRTNDEILLMLRVKTIQKRNSNRERLIAQFNDIEKNIFSFLTQENGKKIKEIDQINQEWVERSNFAEIPSDHFHYIAESLENLEEYFLECVLKEKDLSKIIKKYNIQVDVISQTNKALKQIKFERENLAQGMLARLVLARVGQPDDVLLATCESLSTVWSFDFFKQFDLYFTRDTLSSTTQMYFYNYILSHGKKRQKRKLDEIYITEFIKGPNIVSFLDNSFAKVPFVDFTLNKMDFSYSNLVQMSFISGRIQDSLLMNTDFSLSTFTKTVFRNVDARFANFTCCNLQQTDLQWIFAKQAVFVAARLDKTRFHGANLFESNFERSLLNDTDFRLASLQKANFYGAIGTCNFDGANLTDANLIGMDISKISCNGATLIGTQFIESENEIDIAKELDVLEYRMKNHPSETELWKAIEQNVVDKVSKFLVSNNKDDSNLRNSSLLQHSIFTKKRDEKSPFYEAQSYFYTFTQRMQF